jgi:hypothetical protein
MKAIKFKNWTDSEFEWKFNGIPHVFPAGMEIYMEEDKANHFAKHLVDREMNKLNIKTDNVGQRGVLTAKCFPSDEVVTPEVALDINETKKRGRPAKKVEEFPDLQDKK